MKLGIAINFDETEVSAKEAALQTVQSLAGTAQHGIGLHAALVSGRKSDEADLKALFDLCNGTLQCILKDKAAVPERFNLGKNALADCDYLMFIQAGCTFKADFFEVLARAVAADADVIKGSVHFNDHLYHAAWIDRYLKNERAFALKDLDALVIKRSVFERCSIAFEKDDNALFTAFCFKLFQQQNLTFSLESALEITAPYPVIKSEEAVDKHFKVFDFIDHAASKLGEASKSAVLAAFTVESLCLGNCAATLQLKLKFFKKLQSKLKFLINNSSFSSLFRRNMNSLIGGGN